MSFGIPTRNGLGLGLLASTALSTTNASALFDPLTLFANGEQGAWYDPSDLSTMFTTDNGNTPVTGVEQSVGLILDKSRGLTPGNNIITNGTFDTDTNWTKGTGWSISGGVASRTNTGTSSLLSQTVTIAAGWYRVTFDATITSGTLSATFSGGGTKTGQNLGFTGTYTTYLLSPGNTTFNISAAATFAGSVDNVVVVSIPGNHLIQGTTANRPVLRARYNLVLYSEQIFQAGVWGTTNLNTSGTPAYLNVGVAPDGTTTADKMIPATTSGQPKISQSITTPNSHSISVYAKADGYDWIIIQGFGYAWFNVANGTVGTVSGCTASTPVAVGNGWYRCTISMTSATTSLFIWAVNGNNVTDFAGNGTSGVLVWGVDVRAANDTSSTLPVYQRITTSTSYDTTGFPPYLSFNGTNSRMDSSGSVNFSATDAMTVISGIAKMGEPSVAVVAELGVGAANGSFLLSAPRNGNTLSGNFGYASQGTISVETVTGSMPAPATRVISGVSDISDDSLIIRANGVQEQSNSANQGTGNYANAVLFLGARSGGTLLFNGRLYGLIIRGASTTGSTLTGAESWMNGKTKAY